MLVILYFSEGQIYHSLNWEIRQNSQPPNWRHIEEFIWLIHSTYKAKY